MYIKYYKNLCVKFLTGDINEKEKNILEGWLSESERNKKIFSELKNIWDRSDIITKLPRLETDEQWRKIETKLFVEANRKVDYTANSFPEKFWELLITKWKPVLGAAVVIIYSIILLYDFGKNDNFIERKISTKSEKEFFVLPDGSTVHLNKYSCIKFYELKNEREIVLDGEAFFKVKRGSKPFVVKTRNAFVSVKGTEFEILAGGNSTKVFVKSGVVNFAFRKPDGKQVDIKAGQTSIIENGNGPTQPVYSDQNEILYWIYDDLIFNDEPLVNVFHRLENDYNVDIKIGDKSFLGNRLTGAFNSMDIDSTLRMICLACDLSYEKLSNGYLIKPPENK
jgi:ferric-dicitrate binding protein FerR (iron transport regulator)